jgi:succinate dehydrogenase/fumarate reductase-like Fe-S protein
MEIWQRWKVWGLEDWARQALKDLPDDQQPAKCSACGNCEGKCPNTLEIRERIEELKAMG